MKNINNFTQWKNGTVDVTFARAITHQKHLTQSGCSTLSAVDIFNTLRVFTKEPIREQEIKLECMNCYHIPHLPPSINVGGSSKATDKIERIHIFF